MYWHTTVYVITVHLYHTDTPYYVYVYTNKKVIYIIHSPVQQYNSRKRYARSVAEHISCVLVMRKYAPYYTVLLHVDFKECTPNIKHGTLHFSLEVNITKILRASFFMSQDKHVFRCF